MNKMWSRLTRRELQQAPVIWNPELDYGVFRDDGTGMPIARFAYLDHALEWAEMHYGQDASVHHVSS